MDMLKRKITSQANFTNADILIALKLLNKKQNIGKLLSNRIFLNEASIRSILTKLKDSDYISSSRLGHKLTTKGKHFLISLYSLKFHRKSMLKNLH